MPNPSEDNNDLASPPSGEDESFAEGEEPTGETPSKKSAEARINELVGEIKEVKEQLKKTGEGMAPPPPPTSSTELRPEVKRAVDYLTSLGFVNKQYVEDQLRSVQDRVALDSDHGRLEKAYDGLDGRPKYDRVEVEKYMRDHAIYGDPQIAYDQLHKTELLDWELKKAEEKKKEKPFVEKPQTPGANREDNTITREKIAEWMKTPEGRLQYEKNRLKILSLMQQGLL